MPKYTVDVKDFLLFEEQVNAMYQKTKTHAEAFTVSALWLAGMRPQELLMMRKESVRVGVDGVILAIPTLKRGNKDGGFQVSTRLLGFKRPLGTNANLYLETVIEFANRAKPDRPHFPRLTKLLFCKVGIALVVVRYE